MKISPKKPPLVLHLEVSLKGDALQISCDERAIGEVRTIRPYDEIPISLLQMNARCSELVEILNKANRNGQMEPHLLDRLKKTGQLFYDELFPLTIKEKLRNARTSYLRLSLDENLVQIPWELLFDGGQFFCMRFNMGRLIRTRQQVQGVQSRKCQLPIEMLILADPRGDLKGALSEGVTLRRFMDTRYDLVSATMHSDNITHGMIVENLRRYDMIHFAGHAKYNAENPSQSGWQLCDQVFNARDIEKMAGSERMPAFIFSNACQSARPEAWKVNERFEEHISGFANAFLLTGVRHYLGTSWDIMDETADAYASSFYKHLFSGEPIGKAVRMARADLAAIHGEHTINWAGYILYGDPAFSYFPAEESVAGAHVEAPIEVPKETVYRSSVSTESTTLPPRQEVFDFGIARKKGKKSYLKFAAPVVVLICLALGFFLYTRQSNRYESLEKKAETSFLAGDFNSARTFCQDLLTHYPKRSLSQVLLGKINLTEGNIEQAERLFKTAVDNKETSQPLASEALIGLGRIASIQNQWEKAIDYYEKASQENSTHPAAAISQAMLLEKNKDYAGALDRLKAAKSSGGDTREVQKLMAEIQEKAAASDASEIRKRVKQMVEELSKKHREAKLNATAQAEDPWTSRPLTVWFSDFNVSGYGLNESQPRIIASGIVSQVQHQTHARFVEREMIEAMMAELNIGVSDLTRKGVMLSLGQMMAARLIVTGDIIYSGPRVHVSLRIIETETSHIHDTINELFSHAAPPEEISERLGKRVAQTIAQAFPLRGKILSVDKNRVELNIGKTAGVETGTIFSVADQKNLLQVTKVDDTVSFVECINGDQTQLKQGVKVEAKRPEFEKS